MNGFLLTFEGGEGCGKTTQAKLAQNWLRSQIDLPEHRPALPYSAVVGTTEPGGTPLGENIRNTILGGLHGAQIGHRAELLLFAAARAQHVEQVIAPALASGAIVVCDRYTDSTLVYQGLARGLGAGVVFELNRITAAPKPDLTLWLDLPVDEALARVEARGQANRMDAEDRAFHALVYAGFESLSRFDRRIQRVDGRGDSVAVFRRVRAAIQRAIAGVVDRQKNSPVA